MMRMISILVIFSLGFLLYSQKQLSANPFKIAIMQDQQNTAGKFRPLLDYLKKKGIDTSFIGIRDYPTAAKMFANGEADAMFSGSGIAGSMIIKNLADPEVRPVDRNGYSTYWAVIIASKGASKFTGSADYFKGKLVVLTSLASAGEFYLRSLPGFSTSGVRVINAMSHGEALDALHVGRADVAIVKNRVWDKSKNKYPNLVEIGGDNGENPDGTLIVSKKASRPIVVKVVSALLNLKEDKSIEAQKAKESLEITEYIKTTDKDFIHTIELLKKAGVTKDFNFSFREK